MEKAGSQCNAAGPPGRAFKGFRQGFRGCSGVPCRQLEKQREDGLAPSYGGWRLVASLTQIKKWPSRSGLMRRCVAPPGRLTEGGLVEELATTCCRQLGGGRVYLACCCPWLRLNT